MNQDCRVVLELEFLFHEALTLWQMAHQDNSHVAYTIKICHTKIIIRSVISYFPSNHWYTKWKTLLLLVAPASQPLNTCFTAYVRCKCFVLVAKLHTKVDMVAFLNKVCDRRLPI